MLSLMPWAVIAHDVDRVWIYYSNILLGQDVDSTVWKQTVGIYISIILVHLETPNVKISK